MLSRFSCLRCVLTKASKFVTTRKSFPVSNLLLHTTNVNCWIEEYPTRPQNLPMGPKVAVLISGCGGLDGTPAIEIMSLCANMYKRGITPDIYSTNYDFVATPADIYEERRNTKFEAARLVSFHPIYDLAHFSHHDYIGLAILGGGGIVKLLSNIYSGGWINSDFKQIITELAALGKPIFCTSEAGLLLAMSLEGVKIAIGDKLIECPWTGKVVPIWQVARNLRAVTVRRDIWIDKRKNIISLSGTSIVGVRPSNVLHSMCALVSNMAEQATQLWPRVHSEAIAYRNTIEYQESLLPRQADLNRSVSSLSSSLSGSFSDLSASSPIPSSPCYPRSSTSADTSSSDSFPSSLDSSMSRLYDIRRLYPPYTRDDF
ncbi:hypothetical protein TKK_0019054 [Trichogramma kaykai]